MLFRSREVEGAVAGLAKDASVLVAHLPPGDVQRQAAIELKFRILDDLAAIRQFVEDSRDDVRVNPPESVGR